MSSTLQNEEEEDELDLFMQQLDVPKDFAGAITGTTTTSTAAAGPQSITLEEILSQQQQQQEEQQEEQEQPSPKDDAVFFSALLSGAPAPAPAADQQEEEEEEDASTALLHEQQQQQQQLESTEASTAAVLDIIAQKAKKKEIRRVEHSAVEYAAFRKDFYIEAQDLSSKRESEVQAERDELEITVRGRKPIPSPIASWAQAGLSAKTLQVLESNGWAAPFAVQRQALPCIMSGRDVVGIASTGSGKTLAFIVPMLRHIKDQPPVTAGQGPVALIIAPARELATQIQREVLKFRQVSCACLYGGQNVGDQIRDLKRGNECVVGTPGRIIDVLAAQAGRLLPLSRVTFVVLDEADRLFDMGFTPQVERILCNVRPDRQTVMFSATFPHHVEKLAKDALQPHPLVITVGNARQTARASQDITQLIELRQTDQDKFLRLLQLLGEWYALGGCVLVFCDSQVHVDALYTELERAGYPSLTLHAGKDQLDRDNAIKDFKRKERRVMVATGVAGRGLDVPDLNLVVNYHAPNHVEEYVHRIGRTGRAGRKGTAVTFVCEPDDAKYAGDLVFALKASQQPVPAFLERMAGEFAAKVEAGTERKHASGYRTKGFTFDGEEEASQAKRMRNAYYEKEIKHSKEDGGEGEGGEEVASSTPTPPPVASSAAAAAAPPDARQLAEELARVRALAAGTDIRPLVASGGGGGKQQQHAAMEIEINDLPAAVRQRITSKRCMNDIESEFRVSLTVKGTYFPPGKASATAASQERKLHMVIESKDALQVKSAVAEFHRLLTVEANRLSADQAMDHVGGGGGGGGSSRYRV